MEDGKEDHVPSDVKDDGKHIIRLRGLPWQASNQDILDFFKGLRIAGGDEGIFHVQTATGRATGEAYVQFETAEDCAEALKKRSSTYELALHRSLPKYRGRERESQISLQARWSMGWSSESVFLCCSPSWIAIQC
jgi:RNA recognition motif-containing protein